MISFCSVFLVFIGSFIIFIMLVTLLFCYASYLVAFNNVLIILLSSVFHSKLIFNLYISLTSCLTRFPFHLKFLLTILLVGSAANQWYKYRQHAHFFLLFFKMVIRTHVVLICFLYNLKIKYSWYINQVNSFLKKINYEINKNKYIV